MHAPMQTLYDRLSVSRDAAPEVIRAAYRVLSQRHHPDRNPGDPSAASAMQMINDAYAVLSDPQRRHAYDASLCAATRSGRRRAGAHVPSVAGGVSQRGPGAGARSEPTPGRRRLAVLALLLGLPLLGAGAGLWTAHRGEAPSLASPPSTPVEWRIHGIDTRPAPVPIERTRPQADTASARPPPAAAASSAALPPPRSSRPPSEDSRPVNPLLPIVADPNGRPWPLGAGYVAGLSQTYFDGLSAVVLDNAMNPAPVFVTLVALDADGSRPVRHVHVPAMGRFRVESVRPGRYEVQHRNLVTGALTRSEPFDLRQIDGRYGTQASEHTVALDAWATPPAPLAGGAF